MALRLRHAQCSVLSACSINSVRKCLPIPQTHYAADERVQYYREDASGHRQLILRIGGKCRCTDPVPATPTHGAAACGAHEMRNPLAGM
jgi:hypothetical protein